MKFLNELIAWKNLSQMIQVTAIDLPFFLALQLRSRLGGDSRAAAWWARRQSDHAMTCAGRIRRRASRVETRRISGIDHWIRGGIRSLSRVFFGGGIALTRDRGHHHKGEHT